jgi:hypothetical protein
MVGSTLGSLALLLLAQPVVIEMSDKEISDKTTIQRTRLPVEFSHIFFKPEGNRHFHFNQSLIVLFLYVEHRDCPI